MPWVVLPEWAANIILIAFAFGCSAMLAIGLGNISKFFDRVVKEFDNDDCMSDEHYGQTEKDIPVDNIPWGRCVAIKKYLHETNTINTRTIRDS